MVREPRRGWGIEGIDFRQVALPSSSCHILEPWKGYRGREGEGGRDSIPHIFQYLRQLMLHVSPVKKRNEKKRKRKTKVTKEKKKRMKEKRKNLKWISNRMHSKNV